MNLKHRPRTLLLWAVVWLFASCSISDTEPLIPTYRVNFSVIEDEHPLPRVSVLMEGEMLLTDENGQLFFEAIEPGDYEYTVFGLGYENQSGTLSISDSDQNVVVDLTALFYSVTLHILTPENAPLVGATVSLPEQGISLTTDELGQVTIENLRTGQYPLEVVADEYYYYTQRDTIQLGGEDLQENLQLEDARFYPSGNGSQEYPWEIDHLAQLVRLSEHPEEWNSYFILTEDLDASLTASFNNGLGFSPIGNDQTHFTGRFDGGTHLIDQLTINRPTQNTVGLFGHLSGAAVSNLSLTRVHFTGSSSVGGFVALTDEASLIENCSVSGQIRASGNGIGGFVGVSTGESALVNCRSSVNIASGSSFVGGFVGWNLNESTVSLCVATGDVTGRSATGGFVGNNEKSAQTERCYATGHVTGTSYYSGGFCGSNEENASIDNCFATGTVSSNSYYLGGFCGNNLRGAQINSSYSAGLVDGQYYAGGFLGHNDGESTLHGCYFNSSTSERSGRAVALDQNSQTTEVTALDNYQFGMQSSFPALNFSTIWEITDPNVSNIENNGPYLQALSR